MDQIVLIVICNPCFQQQSELFEADIHQAIVESLREAQKKGQEQQQLQQLQQQQQEYLKSSFGSGATVGKKGQVLFTSGIVGVNNDSTSSVQTAKAEKDPASKFEVRLKTFYRVEYDSCS